jgi:hypothetical protein
LPAAFAVWHGRAGFGGGEGALAEFIPSRRLAISRLALLTCLLSTPVFAESVPFRCIILPEEDVASIVMTNSLPIDASCIVTCRFSTTKSANNPQITCAKPVPAGKEVEMCRLTSGGDRMLKLTDGHAECTK